LGAKDKESLGGIYEENPDIFFEIPLINIDCQSNNDRFAQTNIIDVTASGVSEIIAGFFVEKEKEGYISDQVAQCLLTGIIMGTDSFQSSKTKPKSLQYSASLIDLGADQQEIIRHLYKTQPFHILKLLGRVLAKLRLAEKENLVWAMISLEDFVQSRSGPKDMAVVLEKVRAHYSSASHFLIFFQKEEGSFSGVLRSRNEEIYEKLAKCLQGTVQGDYFLFQVKEPFSESFIEKFVKNL
jgi:nanoRNase/pAp phosphatase (c-di-AMP/oligoRNAs hydrolase)